MSGIIHGNTYSAGIFKDEALEGDVGGFVERDKWGAECGEGEL